MKFTIALLLSYALLTSCQVKEGHTELKSEDSIRFNTVDDVIKHLEGQGVDVYPNVKYDDPESTKRLVDAFNLRHSDYAKLISLIKKSEKRILMRFTSINKVHIGTFVEIEVNHSSLGQKGEFHKVFYRLLAYAAQRSMRGSTRGLFGIEDIIESIPQDNFWKKIIPNVPSAYDKMRELERRFSKEAGSDYLYVVLHFHEGEDLVSFSHEKHFNGKKVYFLLFEVNTTKKGMPGLDKFLNTKFDFEKIKKGITDPETQPFKVEHNRG